MIENAYIVSVHGYSKAVFKNVPEEMFNWWPARNPAQTNPEQYYIEEV